MNPFDPCSRRLIPAISPREPAVQRLPSSVQIVIVSHPRWAHSQFAMTATNWNEERTKLRTRFSNGDIIKATRKELEEYLIVLANSLWPEEAGRRAAHEAETEAFSIVLRHLLAIRLGEELHQRSHRISVWALFVAIGSAVVAFVALFR